MKNAQYSFQFPQIGEFSAKYYFNRKEETYAPRIYPPHLHDFLEIYVLLEGDASFVVEQSLYKLQAGDVIIVKPNEMHNCVLNTNSKHDHLCFWFDVSAVGSEAIFSELLSHDFGKNNLICPTPPDRERLFTIYAELQKSSEEKNKKRLFYLFLEMLDILSLNVQENAAIAPIPDILREILQEIEQNYLAIQTLEVISEKFFVSQSTLNRLFKTYLHTTPKLFLETKRLAQARRLLKNGSSVLSACMESGFTDCSNFIRLFKKRFGVTPKQYREGDQ